MELAPVSIIEKVRDLSGQKSLHEEGQECNASGPGEGKRKARKLECHPVSMSALENSGERAEEAKRVDWQETPQAETQHQRYKRPSEKPTYF